MEVTELQLMLMLLSLVFVYEKWKVWGTSAELFSDYPSRSKLFLAWQLITQVGAVLCVSLQVKLILIYIAVTCEERFWNLPRRIKLDHRMNSLEKKRSISLLYTINKCWQLSLVCGLLGSFVITTGINTWVYGDVDLGFPVDSGTFYLIKGISFCLGNILLESGFWGGVTCSVLYRGILGDVCRFSLKEVLSRESFLLIIIGIGLTTQIHYSDAESMIAQNLVLGVMLVVLLVYCFIKLIRHKSLQDWVQVWFWYSILVSGTFMLIIKLVSTPADYTLQMPYVDGLTITIRFAPIVLSAFYLMLYLGLKLFIIQCSEEVSDKRETQQITELDGLYSIHPIKAMLMHGLVLHLSCCPFFIGFVFSIAMFISCIITSVVGFSSDSNPLIMILCIGDIIAGILFLITTIMLYVRCHTFIWKMIFGFPRKSKIESLNIRLNISTAIFLISSVGFLVVTIFKLLPQHH